MNFLLKTRVKISLMGGYKTGVPLFVETLGGWHGEKNRIVISANSTGPHLTKTKGLGKKCHCSQDVFSHSRLSCVNTLNIHENSWKQKGEAIRHLAATEMLFWFATHM